MTMNLVSLNTVWFKNETACFKRAKWLQKGSKGVKRHPIAYRILINSLNESEGTSLKIMDNSKWKTIPTNMNIKS